MSRKTTMPPSRSFARSSRGILVALASLAGLSVLGCEATLTPGPVAASWGAGASAYVEPPPDITTRPHLWYEDRWVYLVDGSWYAPTPRGWIILHDEPRELGRYRRYYQPGPEQPYAPTPPRERGRYRTH